jgi:hypothetical protein
VVLLALAAAALLALAGGMKLIDPTMTVGALRQMGLPSSPALVRAGSGAELAVGIMAIVQGGALFWGIVAVSYVAFAAFMGAALVTGRPIGSCGCFGRIDTPPRSWHVAADVALAVAAMWAAAR